MQIHSGSTPAVYSCCSGCCPGCCTACIILSCMLFLCASYNTYGKSRDLEHFLFCFTIFQSMYQQGSIQREVAFPLQSGDSIAVLFLIMELKGERETLSLGSYQLLTAVTIMRIIEPVRQQTNCVHLACSSVSGDWTSDGASTRSSMLASVADVWFSFLFVWLIYSCFHQMKAFS